MLNPGLAKHLWVNQLETGSLASGVDGLEDVPALHANPGPGLEREGSKLAAETLNRTMGSKVQKVRLEVSVLIGMDSNGHVTPSGPGAVLERDGVATVNERLAADVVNPTASQSHLPLGAPLLELVPWALALPLLRREHHEEPLVPGVVNTRQPLAPSSAPGPARHGDAVLAQNLDIDLKRVSMLGDEPGDVIEVAVLDDVVGNALNEHVDVREPMWIHETFPPLTLTALVMSNGLRGVAFMFADHRKGGI